VALYGLYCADVPLRNCSTNSIIRSAEFHRVGKLLLVWCVDDDWQSHSQWRWCLCRCLLLGDPPYSHHLVRTGPQVPWPHLPQPLQSSTSQWELCSLIKDIKTSYYAYCLYSADVPLSNHSLTHASFSVKECMHIQVYQLNQLFCLTL